MPSPTARRRATVTALPAPVAPVSEPNPGPDDPTAAFRAAAQVHALKALQALAWLVENAGSEAVRVSAANALIDRAFGRAAQAVRVGGESASEDGQVSLTFTWLDPAKS